MPSLKCSVHVLQAQVVRLGLLAQNRGVSSDCHSDCVDTGVICRPTSQESIRKTAVAGW